MLLNFASTSPSQITTTPTRAHLVLGLVFPLHIIAVIFVSARVLVKGKLAKLGVEDVFIVAASIFAFASLLCITIGTKYGFGIHTADIQPEWFLPLGKIIYASTALSTACFFSTKVSILFFYLRLATEPYLRTTCHITITLLSIHSSIILFINLFACTPVSGSWDRRAGHHSVCITNRAYYYYSAIINIAIDVLLLVLPIPILLRLRLGWRVKVGLVGMFSMGFLILAVSAVSFRTLCISIHSTDIIWDGSFSWMWSMLELNVGIMTACMPAMKLFVNWIRGEKVRSDPENETIGGGGVWRRKRGGPGDREDGSLGSGHYGVVVV